MPLIRRGDSPCIIKIQKIHFSEGSRAGAKSQRIAKRQSSQPLIMKIGHCLRIVNQAVHVPASVVTKASAQRFASARTRPI
jgi:hypothetical protein